MSIGTGVFHYGDVIRKWMAELEWTGEDLVREAGLGKNTLTPILRGVGNPTTDTLERICKALGHSQSELWAALGTTGLTEEEREVMLLYRRAEGPVKRHVLHTLREFDGSVIVNGGAPRKGSEDQ
jgi:transcriptional regulator with XRE-family HTH domain